MARREPSGSPVLTAGQGPDYWRTQAAKAGAKKGVELAKRGPAWETFKQDPTFAEVFTLQMDRESDHFAPDVVSGKRRSVAGAWGIAQIMMIFHPDAPPGTQPNAQLIWAADYMGKLVARYYTPPGKDEKLTQNQAKMQAYRDALSVYNSGGIWATGKNIKETREYVNGILGAGVKIGGADVEDGIDDWLEDRAGAAAGALANPLESVSQFLGWVANRDNWMRVIAIGIGVFLVIYSLIIIAKELGVPVPKIGKVGL